MNERDHARAFLGRGWAFPVCLQNGQIKTAALEDDIQQSIRIILGTNPGERRMRPTFGAGLNRFVFESINATTLALIRTRVEESLIDWEARIDVEEVVVAPDKETPWVLLIEVRYRVRATNAQANFVYPFYLEEGIAQ